MFKHWVFFTFVHFLRPIASFIIIEKCLSLANELNGVRNELLNGGNVDENVDCFFDDIGGVFVKPGSRVISVFI